MVWVFVGVAVVAVFAIAAAFVGSEAFRLGHEAPAAIFDVDEAVDHVAEGLSPQAQARVSYAEVRALILAVLAHLRDRGLSALPGEEVHRPAASGDVVVSEDEAVAAALVAVEEQGLDVVDDDAYEVIRALLAHLDRIGALGPRA